MTRAAADPDRGPLVFLVAGEPSGDLLGARLMRALKAETGGAIRFAGLGGEQMAEEGLASLFPIDELAVMGLVEVVPHLRTVYRRIKQTVAAAEAARPDVLVTIDSPAFTLNVSRRLRGRGIPLVHYVAPSVWAWKPWRARRMAGYLDHLLALLPFEPPYFETHGLATTFVGHPVVEAGRGDGALFRAEHGISAQTPVLCALPGSRHAEVARLAPVFRAAVGLLARSFPDLRVLVPTVAAVAGQVREAVRRWPVAAQVLEGASVRYRAFAAADAALAASGTVAVELAVAGLPAVVAYRVNPLTALLAARLIKVEYASVVNLLLGREVQPELLQRACTAENLAAAVQRLLSDPAARQAQQQGYAEATERLGSGGRPPSRRAARRILSLIGPGGPRRKSYNDQNARGGAMSDVATGQAGTEKFRLLHTMIRVRDLDKSIDFYTRLLGMSLMRRTDYPSGEFTLAFVGYGAESEQAVIELTHNWGQEEPYELGTGFGHLAVGVPDIYGTCERLAAEGVSIPRPPGPMKHGGSVIAFIEDPDGYKIELIERS